MFPLIGYVTRSEQQGDRFSGSVDEPELFWNTGFSAASECHLMQDFLALPNIQLGGAAIGGGFRC
jgi:hypothetical protein